MLIARKVSFLPLVLGLYAGASVTIALPVKRTDETTIASLERALREKNFRAADRLTLLSLLELYRVGEETRKFPCEKLGEIENLWRRSGDGRSGFAAQYSVWKSLAKEYEARGQYWIGDRVVEFCERLGWKQCELQVGEVNYTSSASAGHLPTTVLSLADGGATPTGIWKSNRETFGEEDYLFLARNPGELETLADRADSFFKRWNSCRATSR